AGARSSCAMVGSPIPIKHLERLGPSRPKRCGHDGTGRAGGIGSERMIFWMILKVALKSLLANKLRSVLAMLGIIIGVGAVISMLAIGAGAQKSVMDRMTAM